MFTFMMRVLENGYSCYSYLKIIKKSFERIGLSLTNCSQFHVTA